MFCNNCKENCPFSYKINLTTSPKILIIFINRIEGIDLNIKFEYDEDLKIDNYIHYKEFYPYYKLIGVVTTLDKYGINKHYFSFCKSPIDEQWYKYDDDNITQVINVKQEILENSIPYILFYQSSKIEENN